MEALRTQAALLQQTLAEILDDKKVQPEVVDSIWVGDPVFEAIQDDGTSGLFTEDDVLLELGAQMTPHVFLDVETGSGRRELSLAVRNGRPNFRILAVVGAPSP